MDIKFVLWGCGIRGRMLSSCIEKDRVKAFIDNDNKLVGDEYNGIPIISIETYLKCYSDCFVVVTTSVFYNEIISDLQKYQIARVLNLQRCPVELPSYGAMLPFEEMLSKIKPIYVTDAVVLSGITLFSILLYDYLFDKGVKNVNFMLLENEKKIVSEIQNSYTKYKFVSREEVDMNSRILIMDRCTDLHYQWDGLSVEKFYRFTYLSKYPYKNMDVFKDAYKGQRCFIVGNGPSIRMSDLDILKEKKEYSFGVNRVYRGFSFTEWRPTFYCWVDSALKDVDLENIKKMKVDYKFIGYRNPIILNNNFADNVYIYPSLYEYYEAEGPDFSDNPNEGVCAGSTVLYDCIQIALYMGFEYIYIIGADCDYNNGGQTGDYFIDDYHDSHDGKAKLVLDKAFLAYAKARSYAEQHGVHIYNATRGGKLEVLERVDFDSLL